MGQRQVSGTKEWAHQNENLIRGCRHDCKYCYAKAIAVQNGKNTAGNWKNETVNVNKLSKGFRKREGRIMFPSSHDITPQHLTECITFLDHIIKPGNEVLLVSKPHLECIKAICDQFTHYKDKILFRFTIGSSDSAVLKFWEPGAPDFGERLAALNYAYSQGFQTSVSCEPMLDGNIDQVINMVSPFVTDSIWLGKMNKPGNRLAINGVNDPTTISRAKQLMTMHSDAWIQELYTRYKDNPQIKWKESIKKVVGLDIPVEKGLDV
jgi:uncharacterized Fe-S cluster-containing radical SAM superfamily protein